MELPASSFWGEYQHVSHFVLVPDRGAARRLRRAIAEAGGAIGISVGTWPELIERLRVAYLVPPPPVEWQTALQSALNAMKNAPWFESLSVAPIETTRAISQALREIIEVALTEGDTSSAEVILANAKTLKGREKLHLGALTEIWQRLGVALPEDVRIVSHVLKNRSDQLEDVRVVLNANDFVLTPLQRRLVTALHPDADDARANGFNVLFERLREPACLNKKSALFHLSTKLFLAGEKEVVATDNSIQVLSVRDAREEADVAASMVQVLLHSKPELKLSDIGIVLPSDDAYAVAVRDAFALAGLPLSGMTTGQSLRDFGREYVRQFLNCRQRLAPVMALAAFVTSPLTAWSEATGRSMASMVMRGNFELAKLGELNTVGRGVLSCLRSDDETAIDLRKALAALDKSLSTEGDLKATVAAAREAIGLIQSRLTATGNVDLNELARLIVPTAQSIDDAQFWQDAIAVFRENVSPWKQVRHLVVLGATSGRYPTGLFTSPVFNEQERREIQKVAGLKLPTAGEVLAEGRQRFVAQLGAASESLTILVPERDSEGELLAPSESLVFVAKLLGLELDKLVLRLSLPADRAKARFLPTAPLPASLPPLETPATSLELGVDLLSLRKDGDGKARPLSPSRLETLLVSPLAFVLEQLDAVADEWAPENADPALRGTLAHKVFEKLFVPDQPTPNADTIRKSAPGFLEEEVRRIAPFFLGAAWSVERTTLEREIVSAAIIWGEFLQSEGARIVSEEFGLSCVFEGVGIRGRADALIAFEYDQLLIVDFKKAGSRKRQKRMEAGFDVQLPLYRQMAMSGEIDGLDETLRATLANGAKVAIAYFMMDDGQALTDSGHTLGIANPIWRTISGDISAQAMPVIRRRLEQLRKGTIERDTLGWHTLIDKTGSVGLYALDSSPIISRFVLDDRPGGEADDGS